MIIGAVATLAARYAPTMSPVKLGITVSLVFAVGCGSGWTDADTTSLKDAVRNQVNGLQLCAVDAGTCSAAQVRALDTSTYCTLAATLVRNGQSAPDAGVGCRPLQ